MAGGFDQSRNKDFVVDARGVLRIRGRICVPNNVEIKKANFEESRSSKLSIIQELRKCIRVRSEMEIVR